MLVHGLIHLVGTHQAWKTATVDSRKEETSMAFRRPSGLLWFVACIFFVLSAFAYLLHKEWWWLLALGTIALSQLLIVLRWSDARFGTFVNILLAVIALQYYLNPTALYWLLR